MGICPKEWSSISAGTRMVSGSTPAALPGNRRRPANFCLSLRGATRRDNPLSCGRTKRKAILWANTESVTDFPWESVVAHADSYMFLPVIARSGATRQSVLLAVAQNRKAILWANTESVTDFPWESVVAHADSYMFLHVIARSGATWQSVLLAVVQNRKAILWANTESVTNLPKQQPTCPVSLRRRGLPHQCAHWFAMTCRNLPGVCGCKNVVRNDMQKFARCLRLQERCSQ